MSDTNPTLECIDLMNRHGFSAAVPIYFHLWGGKPKEWFSKQVDIYSTSHPCLDSRHVAEIESEINNIDIHRTNEDKLVNEFQSRGYFSQIEHQASRVIESEGPAVQWSMWWAVQQFLENQDQGGKIRYDIRDGSWSALHRKTVSLNVDTVFDSKNIPSGMKDNLSKSGIIYSRKDSNAYPNTPRYRVTAPVARSVLKYFRPGKIPAVNEIDEKDYRKQIRDLTFQTTGSNSFVWQKEEKEELENLSELISQGAVMRQFSPSRKNTGNRSRKPSKTQLAVPYQLRHFLMKRVYRDQE